MSFIPYLLFFFSCVLRFRLSPKETLRTGTSSSSMVAKATAWSTTLDQTEHLSLPVHRTVLHTYTSPANFCLLLSLCRQIIYISTCSTNHKIYQLLFFCLSFDPFSHRISHFLKHTVGVFYIC